MLGNHFHNAHHSTANISDPEMEAAVSSALRTLHLTDIDEFVLQTDAKSIKAIVRGLKPRKAVGLDEIKNCFLKALPACGFQFLATLYNTCCVYAYFPHAWKIAKVIAIPKSGKDPSDASSYRPISLLSSLGKMFEKIIKSKLELVIEDANIIPDEQFGFRQGHSTTHQLFRLVQCIQTNLRNRNSIAVAALDIEKAFDSVWHDGLIHKLLNLKIPLQLCKLLLSFISDREFAVTVGGELSNNFKVPAGVPQGSVLGPILFSLYLSDIPKVSHSELALFADDTCIFSYGNTPSLLLDNLNNYLKCLAKFFHKWKIKVNASKTQAMFFSRKRAHRNLPQKCLFYNNVSIPWSASLKYLGLVLDKSLTFSLNTQERVSKAIKLIKALYPLINKKSYLSLENKMLIFKMVFMPMLTYAAPVWASAAPCHIKKLQVVQNKLLKV